jgi:branched-chain amino acid transport system permease protein
MRWALLAAVVALALFPLVGGTFYLQLVTKIMIMAIFAMSLDLLVGYTGLVSLGHAAYFGIGAYALWLLSPEYEAAPLWLSLPAAMLAGGVAALVIGVFALRTTGIYFIMATLAFAQMLYAYVSESALLGGSDGVYIYLKPEAPLLDLEATEQFYWFVLAAMVATYFLLRTVLASLFGQAIVGIRVNERRMRALGYPVFRYKLASFAIGGAFAALAGYLAAAQFGFVNPELFGWHNSGDALMMVILGGMGTLFGPVLGAFALVLLQELFSDLTKHWLLLMGGFIVLAVLLLPKGLAGFLERPAPGGDGRRPAGLARFLRRSS